MISFSKINIGIYSDANRHVSVIDCNNIPNKLVNINEHIQILEFSSVICRLLNRKESIRSVKEECELDYKHNY